MSAKDEIKLLYQHLQMNCLCKYLDQTLVLLIKVLNKMMKYCKLLNNKESISALHSSNDIHLVNCSVIETICYSYRSKAETHKMCYGLAKVLDILMEKNCHLTEILIAGIYCEFKFISFSSTKALVELSLSLSMCQNTKEWLFPIITRFGSLLEITGSRLLNTLSFLEQLFLRLKSSSNDCKNQDNTCNETVMQHVDIIGKEEVYTFLETNLSLTNLLEQVMENESDCKNVAIHIILRILLLTAENNNFPLKQSLAKKVEPVFKLIMNSTSFLIFERSCTLLRKIVDYESTTAIKGHVEAHNVTLSKRFFEIFPNIRLLYTWANPQIDNHFFGFGGQFTCSHSSTLDTLPADLTSFRSLLLLYLSLVSNIIIHSSNKNEIGNLDEIVSYLITVKDLWRSKLQNRDNILTLLEDQDDQLIEVLLYCLEIFKYINRFDDKCNTVGLYQFFNPHQLFFNFLEIIGKDYNVLLDLLISEETCFLLYFVKYLKFTLHNWQELLKFQPNKTILPIREEASNFKFSCHMVKTEQDMKLVDYDNSDEDSPTETICASISLENCNDTLTSYHAEISKIFKNLNVAIEKQIKKNLFPYNVVPLTKLLHTFQNYKLKL